VDKDVREYLAQIGSRGGKNRAKNNSPAQLRKWAKLGAKYGKKGGRPKGSKSKPKKGGTK